MNKNTIMEIPFKNSFDYAKLVDKCSNWILLISTFLIISAFVIKSIDPNWLSISNVINTINCFFIMGYAISEFIVKHSFYKASSKKRFDFIDNSFETSFSEDNSIDYYSNDDIEKGIYKMAVNGFENSLFTYNIAKRMLKGLWIKNGFIATSFICLAIIGFNNAFIMLLQLTLPLLLLSRAIKQTIFVNRINSVFENYRRLFQDLKNNVAEDHKNPEILINVIEYEAILSWGCILLNSNIYNLLNADLSKKWEKMKIKYEID